ncbi:MAG: hypothetical protein JNL21_30785 [Myxococcales bacterium]|nr:hypothetical protein [Myxococcales bacterium]
MTTRHGLARYSALIVVALSSGCLPEEDPPTEEVDAAELEIISVPFAFHGICSTVGQIDFGSERCEPSDLPDLLAFLQHSDPLVHEFLTTTVAGNAQIQCTSYVAPGGETARCADVVERDPLGVPIEQMVGGNKNFFVAYAPNAPPHPEKPHWDAHLAGAVPPIDYRLAPVELSEAGTFNPSGVWAPAGAPPFDHERVLKFDPRDCTGCGIYRGPGYDSLTSIGQRQVAYGWWPGLSTCDIETQSGGSFARLSGAVCTSELFYRTTGR